MVRTGPEARRLRQDADDLDAPTLISPQRVDRGFEKAFGERDVERVGHGIFARPVAVELATVRNQFVLRACITNHRATDADIAAVVDEVLAAAVELPQRT
jgi:hypothetical protein